MCIMSSSGGRGLDAVASFRKFLFLLKLPLDDYFKLEFLNFEIPGACQNYVMPHLTDTRCRDRTEYYDTVSTSRNPMMMSLGHSQD